MMQRVLSVTCMCGDALQGRNSELREHKSFKWAISLTGLYHKGRHYFYYNGQYTLCHLLFLSSKAICYTKILERWPRAKIVSLGDILIQETLEIVFKSSFYAILGVFSLNTPLWSLYHLITLSCCSHLQTLGYSLSLYEDFWRNRCVDFSLRPWPFGFTTSFPSWSLPLLYFLAICETEYHFRCLISDDSFFLSDALDFLLLMLCVYMLAGYKLNY